MKIAINGFGRIGKNITRHLIDAGYLAGQGGDLELVAINDLDHDEFWLQSSLQTDCDS